MEWGPDVYKPLVMQFGREKYFDHEKNKWKPNWIAFLIDYGFSIPSYTPLVSRGKRKGQVPMHVKRRYDKLTVLWLKEIRIREENYDYERSTKGEQNTYQ